MEDKTEASKLYHCPECGLHYYNQEIAKQCEAWCRLYKSCNLEVVKLAVENQAQKQ